MSGAGAERGPSIDSLTATVWDNGLASKSAMWLYRHGEVAEPAGFLEADAQLLRAREDIADERLKRISADLKRGHALLDFELIPTRHRRSLAAQYRRLAQGGRMGQGDSQNKTRLVRYNDSFARSAQAALCPFVSRLAGQRLIPTFTYTAHYPTDGNLPFHRDRDQCELTVALCIDRCETATGRSLLCIENEAITTCEELRPGWALIFRGRDLRHGRVTIGAGSDQPTVMLLHYVDAAFEGDLL